MSHTNIKYVMSDFTEDFTYRDLKLTRPHVRLKNGEVFKYCFFNAGRGEGYHEKYNKWRRNIPAEEVEAIQKNSWKEYMDWRDNYNENT